MTSRNFSLFMLSMVIVLSTVPLVAAGNRWNNARGLDPVVVSDKLIIGLTGVPVNQLYVYAYDASQTSWRPIPFQIDEKDNTTDFWLTNPNGIFDENDELVFMAKDMGDQATDGSFWIDDPISKNYERVEITVADTVDGRQAWIYVYRSTNQLPLASESYVKYFPANPSSAGADTIVAKTYTENCKKAGIPVDWILSEGTNTDILDRQKVRIGLKIFNLVLVEVDETLLESDATTTTVAKIKSGPVRVIREVFWHVDLSSLGYQPINFGLPLLYYPFSIVSGGVSANIASSYHISLIRQSFDLNSKASGMKFYNPDNRGGILIDGQGKTDGINDKLYDDPAVNWWLITGNQGSYAVVFRMKPIGEKRILYFYDYAEADENDTGDSLSWGDTGIKITGTDISGTISFEYNAYYLGSNKPVSLGDTLAANFQNPIKIQFQPNSYVPVELTFFKAMNSDGKVMLEWMTQTESNNYGFEIQRKTPLNDSWEIIATAKGQGTTATPHKYSYVDDQVPVGIYYYRLKQIDFDGAFEFSDEIRVEITLPTTFDLDQNYPNPFNPETVIQYRIPELNHASVPVELKIYNLIGDEVKALVQKDQQPGYYSIIWDGKNNRGETVAAGTYLCRFQAGSFTKTNKMLLLR